MHVGSFGEHRQRGPGCFDQQASFRPLFFAVGRLLGVPDPAVARWTRP